MKIYTIIISVLIKFNVCFYFIDFDENNANIHVSSSDWSRDTCIHLVLKHE